jgi:8-oxo-dGTP pyrophosphatase MutT (NUDIX family)
MRRAFSVAVYARRGERVLVIEHRRLKTWLPIGGELEAGETPVEAAIRELREETGMAGTFHTLAGALDGVPPGLLGYEEHVAGSKGLHMNFVFVADVPTTEVRACDEFTEHRWVTLEDGPWDAAPPNVKQLAIVAFAAGR